MSFTLVDVARRWSTPRVSPFILGRRSWFIHQAIFSLCLALATETSSVQAESLRGIIAVPPNHDVLHLAFSPDRSMLAAAIYAGGLDYEVRIYDADTRKQVGRIKMPEDHWGWWLAFSADNKTLYTATIQGRAICLRFWDVKTCKERFATKLRGPKGIAAWGSPTPDGKTLVLLGFNRAVRYDTVSGKEISSFDIREEWLMPSVLSPDSKYLALSAGLDESGKVYLYELATGKCVRTLVPNTLDGEPQGCPRYMTFTRDGKQLICLGCDLTVFDVATGKVRSRLIPKRRPPDSGKGGWLSHDGKSLVVRTQQGAGFGLVDLSTGEFRKVRVGFAEPNYQTHCIVVSRDGRLVAVTNGHDIRIWSLKTKEEEP